MIEEIASVGFEVVSVQCPSTVGDGYPELMLFIALSVKGQESATISAAEIDDGAGDGNQWRRLIVVAVKGAERPVEAGHVQGNAKARTNRVLSDSSGKVGGTDASGNSQPRERFEFVIEKKSCKTAGGMLTVGKRRIAAVVEDRTEEFAVLLVEAVQAQLKVVSRHIGIEGDLTSGIG